MRHRSLTAVDLFSGGGGLTVGLKRAGFQVVSAVELDPHAFATYKANHPDTHAYKQDIRSIHGKDLAQWSPSGTVDLVAGCPPCQGFSSLTAKYRHCDPRNELVIEMARIVREIMPTMVMLENVPGLARQPIFQEFLAALKDAGYIFSWDILQTADYGIPQKRRRLVLLAGRGFSIAFPCPTHSHEGQNGLLPWNTLRNAIAHIGEPVTLQEAKAMGGPKMANWHVVRNLSSENMKRLAITRPGASRATLPDSLRPACHKGKDKGFSNVYGRLTWDEPAGTITGGCTTPSKGRFGHPDHLRTISVREAALVQTFPEDYIFDTDYMEKACDIVGNALPCDFAHILARQCMETALAQYRRSVVT